MGTTITPPNIEGRGNTRGNRPQQQHYVTRAYLEGFTSAQEPQLYVYTRDKETFFRALPKNVAKIRNYYSSQRQDGTYDDRVEHMLQAVIEDPGLHVIRRLVRGNYSISREGRLRLSGLLAIQEYRVRWMREQMERFMTGMLQRFSKAMLEAPRVAEDTLVKLGMEDQLPALAGMRAAFENGDIEVVANPTASLHAMGYAFEPLFDAYFQMGWIVLESDSIPFVTSDCPVHRYYLPIRPDLPYEGLMDKRVQVRFPLSKSKMLVLQHDRKRIGMIENLFRRNRHKEAQKAINRSGQIRHVRVGQRDVKQINAHTIAMAARHVFSPMESQDVPGLFRGECLNMRQVLTDYPDGLFEFKAHYPQHPANCKL
jgi:hypothetical protein